jgi:glycosyltransferase involved in cell wall biosynthesis
MRFPHNVLVISNIPTPYRIPLFNELNAQLGRLGIGFKVVFGALGYARRRWEIDMSQCEFAWEVLPAKKLPLTDPERAVFTYPGLGCALRRDKPSLVIANGFSIASTKIWLRSWFRHTPYLIWSGAVNRPGEPDSLLRRRQRRSLVSRASGFIAYGTRAREYLVDLGADPSRIFIGINTVETSYFQVESARLRADKEASIGGPRRIVYVGTLEQGKRPDLLLHAVHMLARSRRDFVLDLVGSGPLERRLHELADHLAIANHVQFHGFQQRPDVARHLARAFCFVFPTGVDIWGLVLVEAMAAGVPCLASIHAGATPDLIRYGDTGFAVDFSDTRKVAEIINWLLDHPDEARAIGERASRFVAEEVNLAKSAAGFVAAIREALEHREGLAAGPSAQAAGPVRPDGRMRSVLRG